MVGKDLTSYWWQLQDRWKYLLFDAFSWFDFLVFILLLTNSFWQLLFVASAIRNRYRIDQGLQIDFRSSSDWTPIDVVTIRFWTLFFYGPFFLFELMRFQVNQALGYSGSRLKRWSFFFLKKKNLIFTFHLKSMSEKMFNEKILVNICHE